ncbi:MAG: DUF1735 domain-containing protein [Bacteroidales bacterium]|nr:DUF1735 domain-containing protein [Bacteroidales bacterium]MDE6146858.1 DUF1735 domain-containing protein [Bacteroidales bacterium]
MIHIGKYMMIAASAVLAVSAVTGCVDTEEINIADLYRKAYITTDIYPQTEGQYSATTTNTPPSLSIKDGHLVKSEGGEVISYSGIKSYKVYFRTNYTVEKALAGKFAVPSDAEELVAKYNADHGYTGDEEYRMLPSECYTIRNGESTIPAGSKEGEPFVVEFSDGLEAMELGNYIVPIACTLDGSDVELSEGQDMVFMKFSNIYNDEAGEDVRSERILYNNVDFTYTVADGSSFYSDPWSDAALFNDSVNDVCFCSNYVSGLTITFNEPVSLSRLGMVLYDSNAYGNTIYFWPSWTYENGTEGNVGGNYLGTPGYSSPSVYWFDISGMYLDQDQKVSSLFFQIYNSGYNFSELYIVAFDE